MPQQANYNMQQPPSAGPGAFTTYIAQITGCYCYGTEASYEHGCILPCCISSSGGYIAETQQTCDLHIKHRQVDCRRKMGYIETEGAHLLLPAHILHKFILQECETFPETREQLLHVLLCLRRYDNIQSTAPRRSRQMHAMTC